MANTTFSGAIRSENGFKTVTKSTTLGSYTEYSNMNSAGNLYNKEATLYNNSNTNQKQDSSF